MTTTPLAAALTVRRENAAGRASARRTPSPDRACPGEPPQDPDCGHARPLGLSLTASVVARLGGRAVFVGRFTAVLRALVPSLAGTAAMPYRTFAVYNIAGAMLWATGFVLLASAAGPLIAVKLHILTRKTLGGIQTDLHSRALGRDGHPIDGLYAAGEVAGFGGGGAHGYNALEGTCLLYTSPSPRDRG